jgi:cytochrome P450
VPSPDLDAKLLSPDYIESPYPTYDLLRTQHPVYWSEKWSAWLITRYHDVKLVLNDHRRFSNRNRYTLYMAQFSDHEREQLSYLIDHYQRGGLVQSDPPDHTRLKRLVTSAFTPRAVARMRDMVVEIVDDLLDRLEGLGSTELIGDVAFQLPAIVIAGMLGAPKEERDQFRVWSADIQRFLGAGNPTLAQALAAQEGWQRMNGYFQVLLDERRKRPRDDLVSALAAARDDEDKLSEDELVRTCGAMLIAGHETTTNLISSGILALLEHPDQLRLLRNDPGLYPGAIEEFLRYDTPFQSVPRTVTEACELGGQRLVEGQLLYVMLGAANRDPEQYRRPEVLDVRRSDNRHLAFGHGIHFCLGAALARLEGPVAIQRILERFPTLRLLPEDPPVWKQSMVQRGLQRLPLQL